jgi:mRNA guanylyltransferase
VAIKNAWKTRHGQPQPPPQKNDGLPPPPSFPPSNTQPRVIPKEDLSSLPLRYGPLAQSPWSRVSGPMTVAGMSR